MTPQGDAALWPWRTCKRPPWRVCCWGVIRTSPTASHLSPFSEYALEQIELFRARPRGAEMLGGDLVLGRVEAELFAGDLETAADHPGDRAGSGLALAEGRIVIFAAAHVADELEDVAIAVGEIRHQPFAEQVAHFERQPQQHVAGMAHAGRSHGFETRL